MEREEICMNEKEKYSLINNERGNALLYCLLIVMVLMAVTPMVMMNISTEKKSSIRMEDNIQVNTLASSAMEEFLKHVNNGSTLSTVKSYPGWGTKTIRLPNGKTVTLEQTASKSITSLQESDLTGSGVQVIIKAKSGKVEKQYQYLITATKGELSINPASPVNVSNDPEPNKKYVLSPSSTISNPSSTNSFNFPLAGITCESGASCNNSVVGKFMNTEISKIQAEINPLKGQSATKTLYNDERFFRNNINIQYGSPTSRVVVKADQIAFEAENAHLIIYGDLIVSDSIKFDVKNGVNRIPTLEVHGNVYANNIVTNDPKANIHVTGNLYVDNNLSLAKDGDTVNVGGKIFVRGTFLLSDHSLSGTSQVTANSIIVNGGFEIKGKANVNVTQYIAANRMDMKSELFTKIKANDIFVRYDIDASGKGENGNFSLDVGGVIVAGSGFKYSYNPIATNISIRGGSTALQCGTGGENIFTGCNGGMKFEETRE